MYTVANFVKLNSADLHHTRSIVLIFAARAEGEGDGQF